VALFQKGHPKTPGSGRPKGSKNKLSINELKEAIAKVENKKGKILLQHYVERAFENDRVLMNIIKKLLPDLKSIEVLGEVLSGSLPEEEVVALQNAFKERLKERFNVAAKSKK